MPPIRLSPQDSQSTSDLRRDVNEILFRLDRSKQVATVDPERQRPCIFSFPGIAVSGVRSGKWKNKNGDRFTLATVTCDATGGSDCDVAILLNGSTLLTVTLGSGIDYAEYVAEFTIGSTDVIQVETTAAGGQTEVTVLVE